MEMLTELRRMLVQALKDWQRTARMCVLVTVVSLDWAIAQWLVRHLMEPTAEA